MAEGSASHLLDFRIWSRHLSVHELTRWSGLTPDSVSPKGEPAFVGSTKLERTETSQIALWSRLDPFAPLEAHLADVFDRVWPHEKRLIGLVHELQAVEEDECVHLSIVVEMPTRQTGVRIPPDVLALLGRLRASLGVVVSLQRVSHQ